MGIRSVKLLPIILLFSIAAHAQPGGYTPGTQVCWPFSGRAHGYFMSVDFDPNTGHVFVFGAGVSQTNCSNYDGMQPGLFFRDGAGGSNWNSVVTLPDGLGTRNWAFFIMTNQGNQPNVYRDDINTFLEGLGGDLEQMRDEGRLHIGGGSAGVGNMQAYLSAPSNPYATYFATGIWMTSTLTTASANIPPKNYCWYAEDDEGITDPAWTINFFNQCPGAEDVDKFLGFTAGGDHSNTTWGDCMNISGTTLEDSRWIWMIMYGEGLIVDPEFPPTHKITLDYKRMWFDIVGTAGKTTELLIDGDTTTTGYPNFFDGYIVTTYHNEGLWILLDSFINTPKVRVFNNNNTAIRVGFQFYYGRSDTTRHSPWYYATLPNGVWAYVDSLNSRQWSDSVRWVKIDVPDIPNEFREIQIYGNTLGVAPSVFPSQLPAPADPGRYFMGYGKVFTDTLTDDAGYTQRHQGDAGRVDTAYRSAQVAGGTWVDGKTVVFSGSGNSEQLTYLPAKRNGRKQWSYFANVRAAFESPVGNIQRKDILPGADSTQLSSWVYVERMHFIAAAWFGFNTSVNTSGYTVSNISGSQRGRGYYEQIEIGNEDGQWWNGANKFHSPRIQFLKVWAGYNGAKAADPNIKVIAGAATGLLPARFRAYWFVNYWYYQRDDFPADAFAFNEYATTAGGQHGGSPPYDGISPEEFDLKRKLDSNIVIRNQMFPGKEMYCTEFGYDGYVYGVSGSVLDTTVNNSNYNVPAITGQTRDQTKSYWIMRWYELLAGSGWDAAIQYSQRSIGGSDFGTTGFSYDIALPGNPSTYLPSYMQQFLGSRWTTGGCCSTLPSDLYWYMTCRAYRFRNFNARATVLANGDSTGVWLQKYTHTTDADSLIYSVWRGSSNNSTTSNYVINIPGVQSATLVTPAIGDKDGSTTVLNISGSDVTVPTVNEGVQYILVTYDASANQSPTATAGADQSITLPTSQVTVNGSSSSDPDGTISSYLWTKVSGPSTYTITSANSASTTITGLVAGTYVFRLTVTDNDSATDTDDITITVNPVAGPSVIRRYFRGSLRNKFIRL